MVLNPGPGDVAGSVYATSTIISAGIIWLGSELYQLASEAVDHGKNERHGDGGRAKTKVEKQLSDLRQQLKDATGTEKKRINQKIKNIENAAAKKGRGEEHSRANKR